MPVLVRLKRFVGIWGAGSTAGNLIPAAFLAVGFVPPWPSIEASTFLATLASLTGLLFAFFSKPSKRNSLAGGWVLVGALALILVYAGIWSLTVFSVPQIIEGQEIARLFVGGFSPRNGLPPSEAVKLYGPESAFKSWDLLTGRMLLLTSFMTSCGLFTYGCGLLQISREDDEAGD